MCNVLVNMGLRGAPAFVGYSLESKKLCNGTSKAHIQHASVNLGLSNAADFLAGKVSHGPLH